MIVFLLLFAGSLGAQVTVIQGGNMGITPEQLIRDHLIGKGVTISGVKINGSEGMILLPAIGYFHAENGARTQLNMKEGIILTSGMAEYAIGPNNKPDKGFRLNTAGDPDLDVLSGTQTFDGCCLEFDFIPQCDTLKFRYALGSEEFYEFCGKINDAFGFFLSGPGIQGSFSNNSANIAKMPGSNDFVNINNICLDTSSVWDNNQGAFFQYDAITKVFNALYVVQPYQTYHLKLSIADAVDPLYDSGVFLEKGSFSAGFDFEVKQFPSNPASGDHAIEGCNNITISFLLPQPAKAELMIDYTLEGTAIPGLDYETPGPILFQPGQDSVAIVIKPIADGLPEGTETLIIKILKKTCYDTVTLRDTINILDNMPMSVSCGDNEIVCSGDTLRLAAAVTGGVAPFSYLWNDPISYDSILLIYPPLENKTVVLTVTDLCNASKSDTVTIQIVPKAILANQPPEKEICSGEYTGVTLISNISDPSFSWEPVAVYGNVEGFSGGNGSSIDQLLFLNDPLPGEVIYRIMVGGNGCDITLTDFRIVVNPAPVLWLGDDISMEPGSIVELNAGGGFEEYIWSTGSSDSVITVEQGGCYSVTVKNNYSCIASDTIMVNELGLYIPNAFTPNGDGLNDRFQILGFEKYINVSLRIFSRSGVQVFETTNPEEGWDGTFKGELCLPDTYAWILRWGSNFQRTSKGTITLIR